MKSVKDVLDSKGREICSISPEGTVFSALQMMAEKGVGALIVLDGAQVKGIISERDYARKVILKGMSSPNTLVRQIMTTQVIYVRPEQTLDEAMALMTEKRLRHLPVMQGEQLIGVLSIGDLVKASIAEKQFLIDQLANYISGG